MSVIKTKLVLERKSQPDETGVVGNNEVAISFTPPIDEDYWEYRVIVGEHQAVQGFPKFGTIGIGFAVEGYDWNVNLPFGQTPEYIFAHIAENKGDDTIPDEICIEAIRLIRQACIEDGQQGRLVEEES